MRLQLAAAAAALASACATKGPAPAPTLGVEVPPAWSVEAADAGPVPAPGWWRSFGDPRLEDLVVRTLAANQDLAIAAARLEQAEAQARIAAGDLYPQVDVAASAARQRQSVVGLPFPGARGGFVTRSYGIAFNAAWELDLWNRIGAEAGAARATALAARADVAAARLSLAGQTAKAYFALVEAEQQLELARRTLALRESVTSRVRRRYEAGLVPSLDLRLALTNEAGAAALAASRARALDRGERQLEILLGAYPRGTLDVAEDLPQPPGLPGVGIPSGLLARRPDLVAAELRIAAAGGRVEAARAAMYPQLRLTGSLGRRARDLGDLFDAAANVWSLAADLLAPLFHGGRLRAQVDLAHARLAEALASYRRTLLTAFQEVETALAADRDLADQVAAASRQLAQAEAAARLASDRYSAGLTDLLTVLEAERQRLDAAAQTLAAKRERLQTRVDLYLALGGGYDAR